MSREAALRWWRECKAWEKCAVIVWVVVVLAVCGRGWLWPRIHTVYPIYRHAAQRWLAGEDLYQAIPGYDHYRYSPLATVLLVPFSALPDRLGGLLWRLLNAAVYLGALGWWTQTALPARLTRQQRAVLFLLVVPLSVGSLNNAQTNALVLGLLLAAMAATARQRWSTATACVALASFFKLYPVAIGLLLVAVYPRRFAPRLAVVLLAGLLLPFALQDPRYVFAQYGAWAEHLVSYDRHSEGVGAWYRDVLLLTRVWLGPLSRTGYLAIQLLAGAAVAGLCLAARRAGWPPCRLLALVFSLGCCWMTAFGPATESCTYILLAPALAWALLNAWLEPRPLWMRWVLVIAQVLLLLAQLATWFPQGHRFRDLGPQPLAALLFLFCLTVAAVREVRRPDAAAGPIVAAPAHAV
ncbi:MAG TPA: glycosyltransferase family 87 protein [Gemmataceae bacterium]|nr:glycosyltransferase family 87 protein [Gemmataceae bacterium]